MNIDNWTFEELKAVVEEFQKNIGEGNSTIPVGPGGAAAPLDPAE